MNGYKLMKNIIMINAQNYENTFEQINIVFVVHNTVEFTILNFFYYLYDLLYLYLCFFFSKLLYRILVKNGPRNCKRYVFFNIFTLFLSKLSFN